MEIMKNSILTTLALTVILASCSSTKKATSSSSEVTTEQTSTSENATATEANTNTTTSSTMAQGNIAAQANGSTGAMNNVMAHSNTNSTSNEYADMFTKLEMSEEQISTFTAAMSRFKTQQSTTASGEMLGSVESERTRQLESILSSGQYAKYEEWLSNNQ